ncbi:hypothetical protein HAX54_035246 [Datura stramonium]|uniref:Uncharacterized protein n=1 Tax=Datura stramonium TaxID=4076 RepID=A0ABS8VID7_DATST|nr:hypothetical protein [Datura stramonium]
MTPAMKVPSSLLDDENVSPLLHAYAAISLLTRTVSTAASSSYAIVISIVLLSHSPPECRTICFTLISITLGKLYAQSDGLCESVTTCKDIYKDIFSVIQNFVATDKSGMAKLLSTTNEIGTSLFATLESHFSEAIDSDKSSTGNNSSIEAQHIKVYDKLNRTISSLVLSDDEISGNPPLSSQYKVAAQSQFSRTALGVEKLLVGRRNWAKISKAIQEKYQTLEKELDLNNQLLAASRDKYNSLEREFHILKEERDVLAQNVSSSNGKLELVTNQSEESDFDSVIDSFKAQKPISISRSPGL